jgi:biopolymer transport protein ExbD
MGKEEALWTVKKKDSNKLYSNIPFLTLKAWILEARVSPHDLVTNPDIAKWIEAGKISEFAPFFAPDSFGTDVVSSQDMGLPWQTEAEEDVDFDITPMIDVTFLLLTFFLATATFAIHEIKNISIPKAFHTQQYKQIEKVSISIAKDRKIYIGRDEVSMENLKMRLKEIVSKTLQQDIVLSADDKIDYGFIIDVLDEINDAGIKDVKLKIEKKRKRT